MGGSSNYHARSNSLPTRPHPLVTECDEHLCRLKAMDSAPWTAFGMANKLAGLQDLQECVNKLLLLRRTRDAFAAHRREKWVDEVFDGSLRLLDLCSASKDGVIHTKECVRELQSLVRRRSSSWCCGNGVANQVEKYLASRKVVKRAIQKALASVKTYGARPSSISIKDTETIALITLLFDVEVASVNVFEALLSYVLGKKGKAKGSGWALVSKLMRSKRVLLTEDGAEGEANEFATIDAAVDVVASRLASDSSTIIGGGGIESMGDQLGKLEACVQDLEGGLEGLFRRLIRNRVSLLNIINN